MQKVFPAILTKDPEVLKKDLALFKDQARWIHIDIMDGIFVPNTSVSIFELGTAYEYFNLEFHLMVKDPAKYFEDCKEAGAKRVVLHAESAGGLSQTIEKAKAYPFQVGIALNPETRAQDILPYAKSIVSVLIMGIHPGFQGREFLASTFEKIQEIKKNAPNLLVGADGGVGKDNIKELFVAGAEYVAVGSNVVQQQDPLQAFRELEEMVQSY
ncbi:MAG: ribulose-phosphate 3-epimerase [Candidatus Wildermuthbacteria bacterium]|nr:ribulose-phosphate 3-epimerase [Candidatus Wildermuthbacteria bacterium]